ncbi:terminase TerL endonuclease subunit [Fulvimarina sp. MAC3]|uniref:terminase large subunit n=1 Tax=Fulvimarina sp. MAC3 TaxID=3148887 RepID=UPI0031FDC9A7
MGLRGPGANPAPLHRSKADAPRPPDLLSLAGLDHRPKIAEPWRAPGLTRAERVIAFIETLPITQGSLVGTTMHLRDWQRRFVEDVYAENAAGERPVRTAVLSMARKNGKTQLAAALALCHLCGPESEPRGEVYSAANDKFQAGKIFAEMVAIIVECPALSSRLNIIRFRKEIECLVGDGKGSLFAALSADADTKHGLSPSFIVYDELGQAPKRALYEALDTAMGARDNPLMLVISTQAADDHAVMSELVDYGRKVVAGEVEDPAFHLTLYSAPDNADPWDPETWLAANPALGDFRSLSDVERQAAQAKRVSSKENAFRNLILNQRVAAHVRFIMKREWDDCGEAVDFAALDGRECYGGLDLGATRDLSAFVLVFPNDDGTFNILPTAFMPGGNIEERAHEDRAPYDVRAKQGFITTMPGVTTDPANIAEAIAAAAERYDLKAVAYDRWRIEDLKRELAEQGLELPLQPFAQSFKDMGPAVDTLERLVAETRLRHGSNPVLNMCAANAVVERDASGNRKLTKAKSSGRIDVLVALTMALSLAERHEGEPAAPGCLSMLFED